jgi:PadR family transcriptional regulator, regulatory protein PadR
MPDSKSDLLQGTLDLIVLRILTLGPRHGYGIAQRIQQISKDVLQVNQGSLYPALLRLEQNGWIRSKYYSITPAGKSQLAEETENWERVSGAIKRLLAATS